MAKATKPAPPSAAELALALGKSAPLWNELRDAIERQFAPVTADWTYSGQKLGWALRLKRKDRAVVYLKPMDGTFRASLALGERAVKLAETRKLAAPLQRMLAQADQYSEGKAIRVEVRHQKDIDTVLTFAALRMES
jgi:hypothetical protein